MIIDDGHKKDCLIASLEQLESIKNDLTYDEK